MLKVKCGHKRCQCQLLDDEGVTVENVRYCCDSCAEGRGCECTECHCATKTQEVFVSPPAGT